MLTISRRENEAVRIGKDVEVRVVRIQGKKIRLQISAPIDMPIVRNELFDVPPPPIDSSRPRPPPA